MVPTYPDDGFAVDDFQQIILQFFSHLSLYCKDICLLFAITTSQFPSKYEIALLGRRRRGWDQPHHRDVS